MPRRTCAQKQQRILVPNGIRLFDFMEQISGISKLRLKFASDLLADFIAALVNPRTNRRPNVLRLAFKPAPHFANSFFHNPFDRPSPAGVKDSKGTPFCINQNYRSEERREGKGGGLRWARYH